MLLISSIKYVDKFPNKKLYRIHAYFVFAKECLLRQIREILKLHPEQLQWLTFLTFSDVNVPKRTNRCVYLSTNIWHTFTTRMKTCNFPSNARRNRLLI